MDLGVEPAFGLDADQRAHLAEAMAAGFLDAGGVAAAALVEAELKGGVVRGHLIFQLLIHGEVAAGSAAGAAADQDLALLMTAGLHELFLQGAKILKTFYSFTPLSAARPGRGPSPVSWRRARCR